MKIIKYILPVFLLVLGSTACEDYLEKEPLGKETNASFYNDELNATLAINAVYDVMGWDEGGKNSGHNYEFMFGDILSDDAGKGSEPGDGNDIVEMMEWRTKSDHGIVSSTWNNNFHGIYRANTVLQDLPDGTIEEGLKNRIMGEAHFLRAYFYLYLVTKFGGLPVMEKPALFDEWGNIPKSSIAEVYSLIESDLDEAIKKLPLRSQYAEEDLGRATKGAARAFKARAIMYQIGTDNSNGHTWQEVYDLTKAIINSGEYALLSNYAKIFEAEGENNVGSIFEVQHFDNNEDWGGGIKTGTTSSVFQGNRSDWGWGFNNPTQNLVDEFSQDGDVDPRKNCTAYGDGDVVHGELQTVDPNLTSTGYYNRKAHLDPEIRPKSTKSSPMNQRKMRYADVLLMNAEAAYHIGNEQEARDLVNQIRERARNSTMPKGSSEGSSDYEPFPGASLPDIESSGEALLEDIKHERRVELAMEGLRFYDQVRWGEYIDFLPENVQSNALSHSITEGVVNPIPVMAIPKTESEQWNLEQNPGY